LRHHW